MQEKTLPTTRFSNTVENYIKYRPGYPEEIIPLLTNMTGLNPASMLADIGSGTGKSSELFLENGNKVYGIEPNDPMRHAAENLLKKYSHFTSICGTAEETTLPPDSIDIIISGQAFHWFNRQDAKKEFLSLLTGLREPVAYAKTASEALSLAKKRFSYDTWREQLADLVGP